MKKLITLLLCVAIILSLGCGRSLDAKPASSEVSAPASVPAASSEPAASQPETPAESTVPEQSEQPEEVKPEEPAESTAPAESEETDKAAESELSEADAQEREWNLILVNPDNLIPEGWVPELAMTKYGYEVDSRIVNDVTALIEGAAKDNVSLIICYGYRTLEQSQQLFEKQIRRQLATGLSQEAAVAEAKRWVAPPGTSDHHTGLALDIVTPEYQVLNHGFYDTPAGRWLEEHCWEYGFVIRFPKDKQDITGITYEPWHLRFVGKEHAAAMREHNFCLEEYVEFVYGK